MIKENSSIQAFKVWIFPSLVSIVSLLIWNDVNEIKADVKALMAQSNIDKTRIDNLERQVFKGTSKVTIILDQEKIELSINEKSPSILDSLNEEGFDPPYSCRGGVCCSCKAKVLEGKATMKLNYSLTEQEVENGYILTCQAQPASEKVTISYDA